MALSPAEKAAIIDEYKTHEGDTGSPDVQIALLTARIRYLTEHFQNHHLDHASRRGLLKLVGQRRKLQKYLRTADAERYEALRQRLGLRR